MRVFIPTPLQSYTRGESEVVGAGATLAEVLEDLDRRFPGMRFRIVDEQDRVRTHVNFFVGGELVRSIDRRIEPGEDVHIVAALSGG